MANATVEKLKAFGLRYGEKIAVSVAAALFLVFVGMALSNPALTLSPDEVKQTTSTAQQNISKSQPAERILEQVQTSGVETPEFLPAVASQKTAAVDASQYALARSLFHQEPGAGLIRDKPELIKIEKLYAHFGRGGALMYALDENNQPIMVKEGEEEEKAAKLALKTTTRRRRAAGGMGGYGGSGGYGGGRGGGYGGGGGYGMAGGTPSAKEKAEAEKAEARQKARDDARLAGDAADLKPSAAAEKAKAAAEADGMVPKEETKGLRWVALTGILDHDKLRANLAKALKIDKDGAHPDYVRLELQRQYIQADGSWSEWETVDREKNLLVLDNIPEQEPELLTPELIPEALVDPLPFLKSGYYRGVVIGKLVPDEKKGTAAKKEEEDVTKATGGMMTSAGYGAMMSKKAGKSGSTKSYKDAGYGGYGGSMSSSTATEAAGEAEVAWKTEAKQIMTRGLDFTGDPDTTYRYRARIVIRNPNYNRDDVAPGVDNMAEELAGPWSDPTEPVRVPGDISAYAMRKSLSTKDGRDRIEFQVARWDPKDGVTVHKTFDAAPGEIIGDPGSSIRVPNTEGKPIESRRMDFISRNIVLDALSGSRSVASLGLTGPEFEVPATVLALRPDGSVAIHNQAQDANNKEFVEIRENYKQAIEESNQARQRPSMGGYGGGYGGGMGGYGGGGGGGYR